MNGTIEIPFSGDKPSNGYLNYTNNTLTSGCLEFGDYAVTFGGNTTSTAKGICPANPGGNNEQGNGGSGSGSDDEEPTEEETPINPYLTTFDGTYTYSHTGRKISNFGELDSTWLSYLRNDGTTTEVCGTFSNGTVCMENSGWNDNSTCTYNENVILDNSGSVPIYEASCNLTGYIAGKKEEFESKGAACHFEYDELEAFRLVCHDDNQLCSTTSSDYDYVWCGELDEENGCWTTSNYGKCNY